MGIGAMERGIHALVVSPSFAALGLPMLESGASMSQRTQQLAFDASASNIIHFCQCCKQEVAIWQTRVPLLVHECASHVLRLFR
jgi:hypothetical protein